MDRIPLLIGRRDIRSRRSDGRRIGLKMAGGEDDNE
jgi:hypothetical protein